MFPAFDRKVAPDGCEDVSGFPQPLLGIRDCTQMGLLHLLLNDPATFILLSIPLLYSIIIHELAHGWVAYKLGDPTAMRLGRLSLNPLRHLEPALSRGSRSPHRVFPPGDSDADPAALAVIPKNPLDRGGGLMFNGFRPGLPPVEGENSCT
jgi:hypothetical protein